MSESEFDTIVIGGTDRYKRPITDVYARQMGRYAVYQTPDRVVVLYADDPLVERLQRKRLAGLALLRSEINGALGPWRKARLWWSRLPDAAARADLVVASALIEALEGAPAQGLAILEQAATEIRGERASRARLYYLLNTMLVAVAFLLACLVGLSAQPPAADAAARPGPQASSNTTAPQTPPAALATTAATAPPPAAVGKTAPQGGQAASPAAVQKTPSQRAPVVSKTRDRSSLLLWNTVLAGVLGAFYSIVLTIERRDVTNDRRWADHFTDAVVRVSMGALAAFVLGNFLLTGIIQINFGSNVALESGDAGGGPFSWSMAMIAGFLAGFAERLVPDLLNSYSVVGRKPDEERAKVVAAAAAATAAAVPKNAGEQAEAAELAKAEAAEAESAGPPGPEDALDGCDVAHADQSAETPDESLPAASGGVAKN